MNPPLITCPGTITVSCHYLVTAPATDYTSFVSAGGVASDNCTSITVTWVSDVINNQTCANRYTIARTYRATDGAGNTANCEQIITVLDQTAPVIQTVARALDIILNAVMLQP